MKQKHQFIVTLEIDVEGQIEEQRVQKSLRSAVINALDDAREAGFVHPDAHNITIEKFSVEKV
jgi:O-acetyl-ADP-ribose deacetylase (regulator of RNase III)